MVANRRIQLAAAIVGGVLLTGCTASPSASPSPSATTSPSPSDSTDTVDAIGEWRVVAGPDGEWWFGESAVSIKGLSTEIGLNLLGLYRDGVWLTWDIPPAGDPELGGGGFIQFMEFADETLVFEVTSEGVEMTAGVYRWVEGAAAPELIYQPQEGDWPWMEVEAPFVYLAVPRDDDTWCIDRFDVSGEAAPTAEEVVCGNPGEGIGAQSIDGTAMVYQAQTLDTDCSSVWCLDLATGETEQITTDGCPFWSAGTEDWVAWTTWPSETSLLSVSVDGEVLRLGRARANQITACDGSLYFMSDSPDTSEIYRWRPDHPTEVIYRAADGYGVYGITCTAEGVSTELAGANGRQLITTIPFEWDVTPPPPTDE